MLGIFITIIVLLIIVELINHFWFYGINDYLRKAAEILTVLAILGFALLLIYAIMMSES